jgi:hypothetical protein
MRLLQRLCDWVFRRKPEHRYSRVINVNSMSEVPNDIGSTIFLVGPVDWPKWAIFMCPCEEGHRLSVPLMRSVDPHWRLARRRGSVSLWPSVSVDGGSCSSHFWLKENQVHWAEWQNRSTSHRV